MATPFGLLMREYRTRNKVSIKELAPHLKITPQYLSSLELGKKGNPNKSILSNISDYYQLNKKQEDKLYQAAKYSRRIYKLPDEVDPDIYLIAGLLEEKSPYLSKDMIFIIKTALEETRIPRNKKEDKEMDTS